MKKGNKKAAENLQSLMNIGTAIAKRLHVIGITTPAQLRKSKPEKIYEKLKQKEGGSLDKCVLYVLRGAILNIPWWVCKDPGAGAVSKSKTNTK